MTDKRRNNKRKRGPFMELTQTRYEIERGIATVILNRPDKMNALTSTMQKELVEIGDLDFEQWNDYAIEQGWSDGFPLVPPTEEKVERMVDMCRGDNEPFRPMPPRRVLPTLRNMAANAGRAGGRVDPGRRGVRRARGDRRGVARRGARRPLPAALPARRGAAARGGHRGVGEAHAPGYRVGGGRA